jgi:hypothetical protein
MKQYKLIKEYPNSPKLGTILSDDIKNILNYPEFWEEVIEKDYEILSFIRKDNSSYKGLIFKLNPITKLYNSNIKASDRRLEHFFKKEFDIHSVKRLSDGEIFTVGDKVNGFDLGRNVDLTTIILEDNELLIGLRDLGMYNINSLKHAKQPLFKTEDGVDIFKGQKVWYTNSTASNIWDSRADEKYHNGKGCLKYFSTKEAAEEYIILNKTCLSINDIKTYLNFQRFASLEDIKDIVKSKL